MTIIIFLITLGLLIIIHELGHFLTAKKSGALVEEFSVGLPPRIISRKFKGTFYSLGAILFGGFVKLRGEDDPNDTQGFLFLSPGKKLLIVSGGVIFNILLAYLLFSFSFLWGYPLPANKIVITGLTDNSSVKNYLQPGDQILKIKKGESFFYFSKVQDLPFFLKANRGQEVKIFYLRQGKENSFQITIPQSGILGIYFSNFELKKTPFPLNFWEGLKELISYIGKFFYGLGMLLFSLFTQEKINAEIIGPIGIYDVFNNIKKLGYSYVLYFVGILSLNLALINFLPFPGLDGSRAVFAFYEIISKNRLNYQKEKIIHQIGLVFLFLLLFVVTIKDIYKLWR